MSNNLLPFVHLRSHSEYSIYNSICRVPAMAEFASANNMPALAITDHDNIFAAIKFYTKCRSLGVKPIIGCDLTFGQEHGNEITAPITLLACNYQGFTNLTQLINIAQQHGHINYEQLEKYCHGLIMLSGTFGYAAAIFSASEQESKMHLARCRDIFADRFYIAIERVGKKNETVFNNFALAFASKQTVAVVATNGSYFLQESDFNTHEIRTCISSSHKLYDAKRPKIYTQHQHMRTQQIMQELFADLPSALINSYEIAKRCNLEFELFVNRLPTFPLPEGESDINAYFTNIARQGLIERLPNLMESECVIYENRLATEMDVIKKAGFIGYFLIVMEFVKWAKNHGIPVGPGRGSGAGSLVAYVLHITDVNPIEHGLLFERFLNPERKSMPDFDIDFCIHGRDLVIDHVIDVYGKKAVAQIATFGSMAAKAVVRDVTRVLGHPFAFGDSIIRFIPARPLDIKLQDAIDQDTEMQTFIQEDESVQTVIQTALQLEGLARNVGTHAGGVVIAPKALYHFTSLYLDEKGGQSTQFDKYDLEACGIVKFDFLGLKTLTVINQTTQLIAENTGNKITTDAIDIGDTRIYDLIATGNTIGIFQLESTGMRRLIKKISPNQFSDVVALVALYRPGPLGSGMIDDFIDVKHGKKEAHYLLPELKPILEETYGVILYQEQVMQIAQKLAHYSMGEADILRRSMGKKDMVIMNEQREKFCKQTSINQKKAIKIFDLMAEFANYGFNKSHSVAYAIIACQTAWLKAHHPLFFMVANFNCELEKTEQIVKFYHECKRMTINVLPPHVNHSEYNFCAKQETNEIIYGLGGIKGVGKGVVQTIVDERKTRGAYSDFIDFCLRMTSQDFNKKTLDGLIESGALDGLGYDRSTMSSSTEKMIVVARKHQENKRSGQGALFGGDDTDVALSAEDIKLITAQYESWLPEEELTREHKTLGMYISTHPMEIYATECELLNITSSKNMNDERHSKTKNIVIAGVVIDIFKRINPSQHYAVFLEDAYKSHELLLSVDQFEQHKDIIKKYQIIVTKTEQKESTDRSQVYKPSRIQTWQEACCKLELVIEFKKTLTQDEQMPIMQLIKNCQLKQGSKLVIRVSNAHAKGDFVLPDTWRVDPSIYQMLLINYSEQVDVKWQATTLLKD